MYISGPEVDRKFKSTAKAFCYGDIKKRKHAVRLTLALSELKKHGTFNPTLNDEQKSFVLRTAEKYSEKIFLNFLKK